MAVVRFRTISYFTGSCAAQNVIDIGGADIGSRHNSTIPVICHSAQAVGETLRATHSAPSHCSAWHPQ